MKNLLFSTLNGGENGCENGRLRMKIAGKGEVGLLIYLKRSENATIFGQL